MNEQSSPEPDQPPSTKPSLLATLVGWLRGLARARNGGDSVRAALDELIEEREEAHVPIAEEEKALLVNVLELRGRTVGDVMVPRADIVAVESGASLKEVVDRLTTSGHSRLPVYRGSLDNVLGMIHIRDVLAWCGRDEGFSLAGILHDVLIVAPSMQVPELLLEMRVKRCHMALVVDEYGGTDGLATIEDLVEEIVGEIEDEHEFDVEPTLIRRRDGSYDADARVTIEALEEIAGKVVSDEEREEIDTLGGLCFVLAGRVPIRGELIAHPSGLEFEVLDADVRRIRRLRVRGVKAAPSTARSSATAREPG